MWGGVSPLLIISLFVFYLSDYIITGTLQYQAWDASQVCKNITQVCKNTQPSSWAEFFNMGCSEESEIPSRTSWWPLSTEATQARPSKAGGHGP